MNSKILNHFNFKNYNSSDKFLVIAISLIPLTLAISIFVADFLASISGLYFLYLVSVKKQFKYLIILKKEIIYFIFFYLIILISFILTNYKTNSFLASFFYFRYFLLSLIIFYLSAKYQEFIKFLFKVILITIFIVVFDSFVQLVFKYNIFGYKLIGSKGFADNMFYITSFFDEEKKLGSYLVRFIALLIAGSYLFLSKKKILFLVPVIILIVFMTSERIALFHIIWISSIYFLFCSKKGKLIFTGIFITALFLQVVLIDNVRLIHKHFNYTLQQIGIKENALYEKKYVRYFSEEHENLAFTSIIIAKNEFLFGSGVKTFYQKCDELKKKITIPINKRNNKLVCSTHPHNLYLQILSEIGIFGFIFALFFLSRIIIDLIKYFFKKNNNNYSISFFFLNVSILVNIFPLIPSGNFFNNWLSLILYFQIGIYLYFKKYYIK